MTFAINPSLTHIDIPEANIIKLYRSKGQIQLSDSRFRNHPCEAFICIYKVEKTVSARVALLETGMNRIFVYTSDFSAEQSQEYPKVVAEAQSFTASFGFTMEKINLDFSPAMREVIIKGVSVMRPPKKRVKLRTLSNLDHLDMTAPEPSKTVASPSVAADMTQSVPKDVQSLVSELSAARTLIEKITGEKTALEQSRSSETAALNAAAEKTAAAGKIRENKLAKEIEALQKEHLAKDSGQTDNRIHQLELALAQAESAGKTLTGEISHLTDTIKIIANEKLQQEQQFSAEKRSAAQEILKLTREIESTNALLSSEKSLAADKIATLTLFETSWRESQQREEDLCRNIDLMQKEIDRLAADLEKEHLRGNRENALLLRIASLEKELETARTEVEELAGNTSGLTDLEAEFSNLKVAKNEVEAEYIRMANEVMGKEAEMLETLYVADSEILRLSRELELQQQAAKIELERLREEVKLLQFSAAVTPPPAQNVMRTEETTATTAYPPIEDSGPLLILPIEPEPSPESTAPVTAPTATAAHSPPAVTPGLQQILAEDDNPDEAIVGDPEITKGLINEFGSFCGSSGHTAAEFKIDPDKDRIEYSAPAEVLAILYSSNSVQAVPDGSSMQRCKGYVIALKKAGEYKTYLAWYLTESGKVVICNPDQQPADAVECTQTLQDAIAYFEIVGFMMEVEDLGSTVGSYNKAIRKVSALVRK